jgi:predicted MPP superfamily phosphohydrolase
MSNAHPSLESQAAARPVAEKPESRDFAPMRLRRVWRLVAVVQSILLAAHWFLYETWVSFHPAIGSTTRTVLRIVFALAALSFVIASLLAWRYFNPIVRASYTAAAVWVGLLTFCLFAAVLSWIVLGATRLLGMELTLSFIADTLFAAALLVGIYGVVNGAVIRVNRVTIKLPNLPAAWHGRVAALVSDTHLGHIRNVGFMRRVLSRLNQLQPHLVLIAGDMYDGTVANVEALAEPWSSLSASLGALYITGNHEEFTKRAQYLRAIAKAGVRVLHNEKIDIDGMQIVGVHYRETVDPRQLGSILENASIARERPSILLVHAPHRLPIAEEAGISLQVCGHTHGGQFPPASWLTSRIYGPYVHGLNRFGKMLVYTSWGVGTWGPPVRVGTNPEIVLFTFEPS